MLAMPLTDVIKYSSLSLLAYIVRAVERLLKSLFQQQVTAAQWSRLSAWEPYQTEWPRQGFVETGPFLNKITGPHRETNTSQSALRHTVSKKTDTL